MLVAALEAVARIAEQQGARRQQLAPAGAATMKRAEAHERDAITVVAFLERSIVRAIRANDVLDGPIVILGDQLRAQPGWSAEPLTLSDGVIEQDRNFRQDSLRDAP